MRLCTEASATQKDATSGQTASDREIAASASISLPRAISRWLRSAQRCANQYCDCREEPSTLRSVFEC